MWMHSVLPPTPPSLASLLSAFVLPLYTRFPFFPFFFSFFFFTVTRRLSDLLENQYTKRRVAPCLRDTSSSLSLFFFFLHDFSFRRRTLLARRRKQQQQFVSVLLLLLLSVVISVQLAAYSLFSKLHLLFLSFFFFVIHVPCHTWCCATHSLRVFLTSLCSFIAIIILVIYHSSFPRSFFFLLFVCFVFNALVHSLFFSFLIIIIIAISVGRVV